MSEQSLDGEYAIESMLDDRVVLEVKGGSANDGTFVDVYSNSDNPPWQRWRLTKVDEEAGKAFYTIGVSGEHDPAMKAPPVMEAPAPWEPGDHISMREYTPPEHKPDDDLRHRQWSFDPVPGRPNIYTIVNRRTKRCIDVKDGKISTESNGKKCGEVIQWELHADASGSRQNWNQYWKLVPSAVTRPQAVPIYEYSSTQWEGATEYRYSTDSNAGGKDWAPKGIIFHAFAQPSPGTVPIYQYHRVVNEKFRRFFYSADPSYGHGWTLDGIAFHAFSQPSQGTVSIYRRRAVYSDGSARIAFIEEPGSYKDWKEDGIAFHAFPVPSSPSSAPQEQKIPTETVTPKKVETTTVQTGTVWAWGGHDKYGYLGDGTTTYRNTAGLVLQSKNGEPITGVTQIASCPFHCLVRVSNKTVWAWGRNVYGQLGDGTNKDRTTPVPVKALTDVEEVAAGGYWGHSLARMKDGTVQAWGCNKHGQLGDGTKDVHGRYTPGPVKLSKGGEPLTGIIQIAAGNSAGNADNSTGSFNLALDDHNRVWAWGYNNFGQLGDGTIKSQSTPNLVKLSKDGMLLTAVVQIAAGANHALALMNDGTVRAWGHGKYGRLGNGADDDQHLPVQVKQSNGQVLTGITQIVAGFNCSYALDDQDTVWAWGRNDFGQLGDGTTKRRNRADRVLLSKDDTLLTGVKQIAACGYHAVALMNNGTVVAWGRGTYGRLGNGENKDQHLPVKVKQKNGQLTGITQIAAGARHSYALKAFE